MPSGLLDVEVDIFVLADALFVQALTGSPVVEFASSMLHQAAERDLVLHADLIASVLSLLRFVSIRDKVFCIYISSRSKLTHRLA